MAVCLCGGGGGGVGVGGCYTAVKKDSLERVFEANYSKQMRQEKRAIFRCMVKLCLHKG